MRIRHFQIRLQHVFIGITLLAILLPVSIEWGKRLRSRRVNQGLREIRVPLHDSPSIEQSGARFDAASKEQQKMHPRSSEER